MNRRFAALVVPRSIALLIGAVSFQISGNATVLIPPRVVACAHFQPGTATFSDSSVGAIRKFSERIVQYPVGIGDLRIFVMYESPKNQRSKVEKMLTARRVEAAVKALRSSPAVSPLLRKFPPDMNEWPATPEALIPALGPCDVIFQADYGGSPPGRPCKGEAYCYVDCSSGACRQQ